MVDVLDDDGNQLMAGDFSSETDMKVFIDMGHDTVKCARIDNDDWTGHLDHFEIPTVIVPELIEVQQRMVQAQVFNDPSKKGNVDFKFFKQNLDALIKQVQLQNLPISTRTYFERPMINGMLSEASKEPFEFLWENIGRMFVQGLENSVRGTNQDASWGSIRSRLLMTDPSFTLAAGDDTQLRYASNQRAKISEFVFESLSVTEFSLQPAQLPMLLSELLMDGFVVDLGHEATQIVPIYGGMTNIRASKTFAVGGITMDSILMKMHDGFLGQNQSGNNLLNTSLQQTPIMSKYMHYKVRTEFKEEIQKLRVSNDGEASFFQLPDGTKMQVQEAENRLQYDPQHCIDCYLDPDYYKHYYDEIIIPLFKGKPSDKSILDISQGNMMKANLIAAKRRSLSGETIELATAPEKNITPQTMHEKRIDEQEQNYPVTNSVIRAMREFCEAEEIKDFSQLQNVVVVGGGANISQLSQNGAPPQTLGQLLVSNLKNALAAESVTGLNVTLSDDPRLAVMQGARILMNLSTNQKHFVTAQEYQEHGSARFQLINQTLI